MFEKDFNDKKEFRIIIPLVFYHGEKKWDIPKEFLNLYDLSDNLKDKMLNFSYVLYDTADFDVQSPNIFHKNLLLTSSLIALKTAFDKDDIQSVRTIIKNLNSLGFLTEFQKAEIFLIYILRTKNLDEREIIEIIKEQNPEGGNTMLTFESYFTEKGIEKGKIEGIEKGIEKGKIETAKNLKKLGVSAEIISQSTGLTVKEIELL